MTIIFDGPPGTKLRKGEVDGMHELLADDDFPVWELELDDDEDELGKAAERDGDGDGLVADGTPQEHPVGQLAGDRSWMGVAGLAALGVGGSIAFKPGGVGRKLTREAYEYMARKPAKAAYAKPKAKPHPDRPKGEAPIDDELHEFATKTSEAFPEGTTGDVSITRTEWRGDTSPYVNVNFKGNGFRGNIARTFKAHKDGTLEVKHDAFEIVGKQGAGIAKKVLKAQVEQYEKMGVDRVTLVANMEVGGYAWARYGFVPDQRNWNGLRRSLRKDIDSGKVANLSREQKFKLRRLLRNSDPKTMWKLADAKIGDRSIGKELLLDRAWSGHLDLGDADAMARFNHYVGNA